MVRKMMMQPQESYKGVNNVDAAVDFGRRAVRTWLGTTVADMHRDHSRFGMSARLFVQGPATHQAPFSGEVFYRTDLENVATLIYETEAHPSSIQYRELTLRSRTAFEAAKRRHEAVLGTLDLDAAAVASYAELAVAPWRYFSPLHVDDVDPTTSVHTARRDRYTQLAMVTASRQLGAPQNARQPHKSRKNDNDASSEQSVLRTRLSSVASLHGRLSRPGTPLSGLFFHCRPRAMLSAVADNPLDVAYHPFVCDALDPGRPGALLRVRVGEDPSVASDLPATYGPILYLNDTPLVPLGGQMDTGAWASYVARRVVRPGDRVLDCFFGLGEASDAALVCGAAQVVACEAVPAVVDYSALLPYSRHVFLDPRLRVLRGQSATEVLQSPLPAHAMPSDLQSIAGYDPSTTAPLALPPSTTSSAPRQLAAGSASPEADDGYASGAFSAATSTVQTGGRRSSTGSVNSSPTPRLTRMGSAAHRVRPTRRHHPFSFIAEEGSVVFPALRAASIRMAAPLTSVPPSIAERLDVFAVGPWYRGDGVGVCAPDTPYCAVDAYSAAVGRGWPIGMSIGGAVGRYLERVVEAVPANVDCEGVPSTLAAARELAHTDPNPAWGFDCAMVCPPPFAAAICTVTSVEFLTLLARRVQVGGRAVFSLPLLKASKRLIAFQGGHSTDDPALQAVDTFPAIISLCPAWRLHEAPHSPLHLAMKVFVLERVGVSESTVVGVERSVDMVPLLDESLARQIALQVGSDVSDSAAHLDGRDDDVGGTFGRDAAPAVDPLPGVDGVKLGDAQPVAWEAFLPASEPIGSVARDVRLEEVEQEAAPNSESAEAGSGRRAAATPRSKDTSVASSRASELAKLLDGLAPDARVEVKSFVQDLIRGTRLRQARAVAVDVVVRLTSAFDRVEHASEQLHAAAAAMRSVCKSVPEITGDEKDRWEVDAVLNTPQEVVSEYESLAARHRELQNLRLVVLRELRTVAPPRARRTAAVDSKGVRSESLSAEYDPDRGHFRHPRREWEASDRYHREKEDMTDRMTAVMQDLRGLRAFEPGYNASSSEEGGRAPLRRDSQRSGSDRARGGVDSSLRRLEGEVSDQLVLSVLPREESLSRSVCLGRIGEDDDGVDAPDIAEEGVDVAEDVPQDAKPERHEKASDGSVGRRGVYDSYEGAPLPGSDAGATDRGRGGDGGGGGVGEESRELDATRGWGGLNTRIAFDSVSPTDALSTLGRPSNVPLPNATQSGIYTDLMRRPLPVRYAGEDDRQQPSQQVTYADAEEEGDDGFGGSSEHTSSSDALTRSPRRSFPRWALQRVRGGLRRRVAPTYSPSVATFSSPRKATLYFAGLAARSSRAATVRKALCDTLDLIEDAATLTSHALAKVVLRAQELRVPLKLIEGGVPLHTIDALVHPNERADAGVSLSGLSSRDDALLLIPHTPVFVVTVPRACGVGRWCAPGAMLEPSGLYSAVSPATFRAMEDGGASGGITGFDQGTFEEEALLARNLRDLLRRIDEKASNYLADGEGIGDRNADEERAYDAAVEGETYEGSEGLAAIEGWPDAYRSALSGVLKASAVWYGAAISDADRRLLESAVASGHGGGTSESAAVLLRTMVGNGEVSLTSNPSKPSQPSATTALLGQPNTPAGLEGDFARKLLGLHHNWTDESAMCRSFILPGRIPPTRDRFLQNHKALLYDLRIINPEAMSEDEMWWLQILSPKVWGTHYGDTKLPNLYRRHLVKLPLRPRAIADFWPKRTLPRNRNLPMSSRYVNPDALRGAAPGITIGRGAQQAFGGNFSGARHDAKAVVRDVVGV